MITRAHIKKALYCLPPPPLCNPPSFALPVQGALSESAKGALSGSGLHLAEDGLGGLALALREVGQQLPVPPRLHHLHNPRARTRTHARTHRTHIHEHAPAHAHAAHTRSSRGGVAISQFGPVAAAAALAQIR